MLNPQISLLELLWHSLEDPMFELCIYIFHMQSCSRRLATPQDMFALGTSQMNQVNSSCHKTIFNCCALCLHSRLDI